MKLHDGSVGFLVAYGIPALVVAGIAFGPWSGRPNLATLLPLVVAYILVPVFQDLSPRPARPVDDTVSARPLWRRYYRALPLLAIVPQLAMLAIAAQYWVHGPLSTFGRLVHLLSTGMFSAMFAITIAHELIHRRWRLDRWMGGLLLSTVSFGTFKVVHVRIHHRFVGTPRDFATARRGQTIYGFWLRSAFGYWREALRCERERLGRRGLPMWRSELVAWYGLSALWLGLAWAFWGPWGAVFFAGQSVIAILKLDAINYLQHYGLTRELDAAGRFEPVGVAHAWSQGLVLHDLLLFNLFRHSDHHVHPRRAYQALRHLEDAPAYPHNFSRMLAVMLVPPLFRRAAHPVLDRLPRARPTAIAS